MIIVGPGTLHWVRSEGNLHSVHISWNIAYLNNLDVFFLLLLILD